MSFQENIIDALNGLDDDEDDSLNSDDIEYDMLLQECQDLIEQATNLQNENIQALKIADLGQDNESEESVTRVRPFTLNVKSSAQLSDDHKDWKLENIEQVWEELIKEKKMLEDQWTDVTLDLRKKQRQLEDFNIELKITKEKINQVSKNLKEKEDFAKILKDQYEILKSQKI